MDIEQIRDTLLQAQEQQRVSELAAAENNALLGGQQITYNNEAQGTLYSGLPTFQRAQLAASTAGDIAGINSSYAQNTTNVWNTVQNALDRINAMNEATAYYNSRASRSGSGGSGTTTSPYQNGYEVELNGKTYVYNNGRFVEKG